MLVLLCMDGQRARRGARQVMMDDHNVHDSWVSLRMDPGVGIGKLF